MKNKKILGFTAAMMLVAVSLVGCGSAAAVTAVETPADTAQEVAAETAADTVVDTATEADIDIALTGNVSMAGSTSMEKLANALAESFMEKYPDVTVTAEFTGSSAGVEAVTAGSVDIGNSSRGLKEEEKAAGIVENVVAIDGIAVVVDPSNQVTGLSKEQLSGIYQGEIKNWSEVGGAKAPIVVVGREAGSGTRDAFEELLEIKDACAYANELDSTGAVVARVASTPGSIGYVSLDVLDGSVAALALGEIAPTEENIKAGSYLLSRPFVLATKGEIAEQSDVVKAMFDYLASAEGKELVKSVGLITVD